MITEAQLIEVLRSLMGKRDFLQGKGLIGRIAAKAGIDPVEAKMALGKLARQGVIEGVSHHGEAIGRVSLNVAAPAIKEPESLVSWRDAMRASGLTDVEVLALESCHVKLDGFSYSDLRNLAKGLLAMRKGQSEEKETPRFVLSAKYLLGSSKLLASLPAPALRSFGIEIDTIPDAIPQVITAGPERPEAVLLIENPHSFEEAIAAGCAEKLALVITFGYGLSRSGEAYGNSLVNLVDQANRLVPLIRVGNPPSPKTLLEHLRIFFWGDLDREGLRIYASLRKRIPVLRASALYIPMIEALKLGKSHPYTKATAKENQGTVTKLSDDVARLVPLCADRGVDQEVVCRDDISALAPFSLEEKLTQRI